MMKINDAVWESIEKPEEIGRFIFTELAGGMYHENRKKKEWQILLAYSGEIYKYTYWRQINGELSGFHWEILKK